MEKKKSINLLLIAFLLGAHTYGVCQEKLFFRGDSIYIHGINIPWRDFAKDFGENYNTAYFENVLNQCASNGVNTVRVWVHADGRSSPEFNANDQVVGLSPTFFSDLDHFLDYAEQKNILVILCLWSFDMLKDYTNVAGVYAGMHHTLINDSLATLSYIHQVLEPLAIRYSDQCNLLAIDVINEPEWGITENTFNINTVDSTVSKKHMQRFVAMQTKAIHDHSDLLVTVGSASLGWMSTQSNAQGNWWSDSAMLNVINHPNACLDFYQIHYWSWMGLFGFDPYIYDFDFWGLDKPTFIGETPANSSLYPPLATLNAAKENNWSGVLFWSYDGNDGFGSWNDCSDDLLSFYQDNSLLTQYESSCNLTSQNNKTTDLIYSVYPNPAYSFIHIKTPPIFQESNFEIYNDMGQLMLKTSSTNIDVSGMENGLYLIKHLESKKRSVFIKN